MPRYILKISALLLLAGLMACAPTERTQSVRNGIPFVEVTRASSTPRTARNIGRSGFNFGFAPISIEGRRFDAKWIRENGVDVLLLKEEQELLVRLRDQTALVRRNAPRLTGCSVKELFASSPAGRYIVELTCFN